MIKAYSTLKRDNFQALSLILRPFPCHPASVFFVMPHLDAASIILASSLLSGFPLSRE
jgi:hypothetical protein